MAAILSCKVEIPSFYVPTHFESPTNDVRDFSTEDAEKTRVKENGPVERKGGVTVTVMHVMPVRRCSSGGKYWTHPTSSETTKILPCRRDSTHLRFPKFSVRSVSQNIIKIQNQIPTFDERHSRILRPSAVMVGPR